MPTVDYGAEPSRLPNGDRKSLEDLAKRINSEQYQKELREWKNKQAQTGANNAQ